MSLSLARAGFGVALSALGVASALACPRDGVASITPDGDVRIGDNVTIVQRRSVDGVQIEIGVGGRASNGVASIMGGSGVRVGDGTNIVQTGRLGGAQVGVAANPGAGTRPTSPGGGKTVDGRLDCFSSAAEGR